ncbi:band 4.1-like protein 2 isoform X6 [Ambystoma mexicanum]|uniref:band 4.1-like protein 2 isoform X6 n=1 Tax=Ambystoma mexicanum TaxID=8296 RepID=UPI0037E88254
MTTEAGPVPEVKDSPKKKAEQLGQPQTSEELQQMGVETINENGSEDMEHTGDAKPEADAMPSPTSPAPSSPTSPGSQKKEKRSPDGKGISRFMPPWLRKQKSQSHVDPKDVDEMKPLQDIEENKAIVLEVEVLETDKELRKSSESQPKIDDVEEKKSVSSAGTQPAKEEGLETGREIQVVAEEKTEKEEDEETKKDAKENSVKSKTEKVSEKLPKKLKTVLCKVIFLDKTEYSYEIEKRAKGQVLFDKVCEQLNLLEKDYFGLTFQDHANQKNWVDPAKGIKRQIRSMPWLFGFNVKFYPPDPSQLTEDLTRYFLCLQLRQDVASGRLPCSFVTHSLLGSYTLQAELGDYDPEEHNVDYISEFQFAPNQNKELEEKVVDLHKSHRGLTPSQADLQFVENAKKLSMYGVDLHRAKDSEAVDIMLGISASGLFIYKDRLRINRFAWPKILKISYKRNNFYIKVRPAEQDQFESTIGFKLPNHRAAKRLWKVCVEHHAFFRLKSPDKTPKAKFLTLGSKFRYSGRTQAQTQEASTLIDRPAPYFERTSSKRISRSLDGAPMVCITDTNLSNDIAATSNSVDGDFPGIHVVEDGTSTEASKGQAKNKSLRIEGENIYVRHSNLMLEDLDKTQDELLKHQASISELKRSFMESSPEPRPNEWEKRRIAPLSVQAQGSSDDIQNIVDNHMEFMTKETIVNEEVTKELNGDLQNHAEDTGRTLNLKVLVKKDSASFSSSESSSEDEDDGAEYQPDNRVAQEVIEELEEQVEDVEEHFPAGGVHSIETIDAGPITLKNIHAKGMLEPLLHETIVTPCIENNQELPEGISQEVREEAEEHPGVNGDDSHFEVEISPQIIFCSEPPVVKTEMVTISDASQKMEICTKEVPLVQTESKTITFESSQVDGSGDSEPGVLMSAQTITSESVSTTTTTHITKTIKGGVSETRIEKRIVITGDADIDHDEALAQAIKEAKELHPDMSVTRVVVHKETEVTDEGDEVYP